MDNIKKINIYQRTLKLLAKNRVRYLKDKPFILLDGILETSHNLFINAAIGLAAHEVYGYNIAFLTYHTSEFVNDIANAIGAKVINISDYGSKKYPIRKLKYYADRLKYRNVRNQDILTLKHNDIYIGDLVYDTLIRNYPENYTHAHFKAEQVKNVVANANFNFHALSELFGRNNIKFLSLSHKYYVRFGMIARIATQYGVPFISKSRSHLNLICNFEEHLFNDYYIDQKTKILISNLPENLVNKYIQKRFSGTLDQFDVKFAFAFKKNYSITNLKNKLALDSSLPIAAIMPHAFSDAPHSDKSMLYNDYYEWFVETLHIIQKIDYIQWIIKPHPSSGIYQEEGVVSKLIESSSHIKIVPPDVRTDSVLKLSDAIVTVRGTAGLEGVLFDAKTILAGDAYYMELGFTENCKTIEEYKGALAKITKKQPIDESVKRLAKNVIYWRNESFFFYSGIFGPERVPNLSKEEALKHDIANYQHVNDFLSKNEYKSDLYYQQLVRFFSEKKQTLCALDFLNFEQ